MAKKTITQGQAAEVLNQLPDLVPQQSQPTPRTPQQELEDEEKVFKKGWRESIEALRRIRDRKLYAAAGFGTFPDYMAGRWGYTPSWATQQINKLMVMELLESQGVVGMTKLSVDAANTLWSKLGGDPDALVRAYLEAEKTGKKLTEKNIGASVKKQERFIWKKKLHTDLTYQEFEAIYPLGESRRVGLLPQAKERTAAALLAVAEANNASPTDQELLEVARGPELVDLAKKLVRIQEKRDESYANQVRVAALEAELNKLKGTPAPATAPAPADAPADTEEDAEEEEQKYQVEATGALLEGGKDWLQDDSHGSLTAPQLSDLLKWLATGIVKGTLEIDKEVSITIRPA